MIPRIYVQVGLYAEGRNDYDFLLPLLERLLDELLAQHWPGRATQLPSPLALDADEAAGKRREVRIAQIIQRYSETCQLFVIHADADGDAGRARDERVEPGVRLGLTGLDPLAGPVATSACIPIKMTEAWMLVDAAVLVRLGCGETELPRDPEVVGEPKQVLQGLLQRGRRGRLPNIYEFVGANVNLAALRRLAGFRVFEDELLVALREVVDRR